MLISFFKAFYDFVVSRFILIIEKIIYLFIQNHKYSLTINIVYLTHLKIIKQKLTIYIHQLWDYHMVEFIHYFY